MIRRLPLDDLVDHLSTVSTLLSTWHLNIYVKILGHSGWSSPLSVACFSAASLLPLTPSPLQKPSVTNLKGPFSPLLTILHTSIYSMTLKSKNVWYFWLPSCAPISPLLYQIFRKTCALTWFAFRCLDIFLLLCALPTIVWPTQAFKIYRLTALLNAAIRRMQIPKCVLWTDILAWIRCLCMFLCMPLVHRHSYMWLCN